MFYSAKFLHPSIGCAVGINYVLSVICAIPVQIGVAVRMLESLYPPSAPKSAWKYGIPLLLLFVIGSNL